MRRKYDDNFKSKVAIEAMQNTMTLAELASKYKVHPNMITQWKKHLQDHAAEIFSKKKDEEAGHREEKEKELYAEIGKLKVELEIVKKNARRLGVL
jgi:transposase